jgi:DNA-binding response OmpR family regulator
MANIGKYMNLQSLLISRDAALLGVLRPTLEKMSVSVEVCSGTQTGEDLLGKHKFDAVIVDCDDLSGGVDLIKRLRRTQSNASSVAFAVLNGKTTTKEAFQIGANFVLQKPLTPLHASRCFNAAMSFMVREQRRFFRHPVEMPVRIGLAQGSEMAATTSNLSEGGMAIRFSGKLTKDADCKLQITLPGSHTSLELQGKIAWVDEGHAGIKFVDVPQSSQYQLDTWLTERMQNQVPKRLQGYLNMQ